VSANRLRIAGADHAKSGALEKMLFLLVSAQLSSSLCPTFGALDRRHVSIWLGSWPFVWDSP
jgi:hypothetical protein